MKEEKIIVILERGFRKIGLPDGYVINLTSCDDGCMITTEDMQKDLKRLNQYIGLPIYEIALDNNTITKGYRLGECKMVMHDGDDCIYWNTESISGNNKIKHVK